MKETGRYLEANKVTSTEAAEFCAHLKRAMKEYRISGDLKGITRHLETLLPSVRTRQMAEAIKKASKKNPNKSQAEIFREVATEMHENEEAMSKSLREIAKGKDWDIREALEEKRVKGWTLGKVLKWSTSPVWGLPYLAGKKIFGGKREKKDDKKDEKQEGDEKEKESAKSKEKSGWTVGKTLKWASLPLWVSPYLTYKAGEKIAKWAWPKRGKIAKWSTVPIWGLPWAAWKGVKGTVGLFRYDEEARKKDEARSAKKQHEEEARKHEKEAKKAKKSGGGH